jgi:succinate dehydrogenase/fumarate reductase flavoprotein subunit
MGMFTCKESLQTDVLIVGGGLAAIRAALTAAKTGVSVTMVIRSRLCSGSSFYPLTAGLGYQAPCSEEDKAFFLEELSDSGARMNDEKLCKIFIDEIQERGAQAAEIVVKMNPITGRKACFAKRNRDLAAWGDWSAIRENVASTFHKYDNITVLEFTDILELLKKGDRLAGAVAADSRNNIVHIEAKAVMLATGGFCGLYKHCLTTSDVAGTGHDLALDAGAELINLEFNQFIPGMITPIYKTLFSEDTLRYAQDLLSPDGKDILLPYVGTQERKIECFNSRGLHGPFTVRDISSFFDISMMNEAIRTGDESGFRIVYDPKMYNAGNGNESLVSYLGWLTAKGIDLVRDKIMIAPFGHASNGGIKADENARTSVENLFCAGEASGGMHGADRHGGVATGICFVYGHRAGNAMAAMARQTPFDSLTDDQAMAALEDRLTVHHTSGYSCEEVTSEIRRTLWRYANVVRSEEGLTTALKNIEELESRFNPQEEIRMGGEIRKAVGTFHSIRFSKILIRTMLMRKESRGSHYRTDYPERDDKNFGRRLVIKRKDETCGYSWDEAPKAGY